MRNKQTLIIFCIVAALCIFLAVLLISQLEIVPINRWQPASQEVRNNPYFALDRWLKESSHTVRTLPSGMMQTILGASERTIFIENSQFNWSEDTPLLIPWLQKGGQLIVSVDYTFNTRAAWNFSSLVVETLGVELFFGDFGDLDNQKNGETGQSDRNEISDTAQKQQEAPPSNKDRVADARQKGFNENDAHEKTHAQTPLQMPPRFDNNVAFNIIEQTIAVDKILVMRDNAERIRLVKLHIGDGWIVLIGEAFFLHNNALNTRLESQRHANIALASTLFFDEANQTTPHAASGVLFIRRIIGSNRILGNLAERGNPILFAVSLLLLVVIGFWMVIPLFGRYAYQPTHPGKPLRQRFLAEGRFLKKYRALGKYLEVYQRELEQRSKQQDTSLTFSASTDDGVKNNVVATRPITFRQFIAVHKMLMEQLEKLERK